MSHSRRALPLTLPLIIVAAAGAASAQEAFEILRERANRPADPGPSVLPEALGPVGAGNALFSMEAADNAACVRAIDDVTGDGVGDVLVGIDKSGTPNVLCLSGASSGTATVAWAYQTAGGLSGGAPYGDQSLVLASDADGNGYSNVLVGTGGGGRTVYNLDGQAGATNWSFDTYMTPDAGWIYSLCELNDMDGDGTKECAFGVGSMNDKIYLVEGGSQAQATVRWEWYAGDATYSVRNLGDVNGDGDDDVLAAVGDNVDLLVCLDGGTTNPSGSVLWTYDPGTSLTVFACEVLPDVTGDGVKEALVALWTLNGSAVRCVNGATGGLVWSSTQVSQYAQMLDLLEDVTGDGTPEVIVSSWENAVIVLDGSDGSLLWKTTVGTLNGGDVWTARAIDDLNGDGRQDVIAGSFDYHVYALDGDTGEVFWAFDAGNRVFSVAPVADLNGDGTPEVAVGTQDTNNKRVVYVLEGDAGIPYPGLTMTGTGRIGTSIAVELTGPAGSIAWPAFSANQVSITLPAITGTLELGNPITFLPRGPIPAGGAYVLGGMIPLDPGLVGRTIYNQGLVYTGPPFSGAFSDVEELLIREP